MRLLPLLLAAVLGASCASKQKPPPPPPTEPKGSAEFQLIADLEDRRSLGEEKLPDLALIHTDPLVRARALTALGRIQDLESIDHVLKGLTDPDVPARIEAAFAAGLLGMSWAPLSDAQKTKLTDGLKTYEAAETEAPVKLALIDALARVGTVGAADRLIERLSVAGDVAARAALGLGVEIRQMAPAPLPPKAYPALAALLKKELPISTRYGGGYALAASKNALARPGLSICVGDEVSEIRAICAKGLGDAGTEADAPALRKLLDDADYRVAVEAARGLAKLANRCKANCNASLEAIGDLNLRVERLIRGDTAGGGQPVLALAQTGLPLAAKPTVVALRSQLLVALTNVKDAAIKKDIANIDCRLAALLDRINGELKEVLTCGAGVIPEAQRLAVGLREVAANPAKDPAKRAEEFLVYLDHADPKVKLAAIEALGDNRAPEAAPKLRPILAGADFVLVGAAATALAKLGDKESIPTIVSQARLAMQVVELAPPLGEAIETLAAIDAVPAMQEWLKSTHATVRNAGAQALTKLTGKPVVALRRERPAEGEPAGAVPIDATITFKTEKGDFTVKLFTHDAPLTSFNFYSLAKKGFFKNVDFHRIVPDFVAQGGDPRGDGEGGPGYTIRCEVNHHAYTRGVMGVALGGKDTGGSQFFVTLAPAPHLDGRYTSFGELTAGQEVVDALLEGDKILDAVVAP